MTGGRLATIWRHPIKAHGRERVAATHLAVGGTLLGDRVWAVTHAGTRAVPGRGGAEWAACANFARGAGNPALMAITATTHPQGGRLTLSHPARPALTFDPSADATRFLDWVAPLMDPERPEPTGIVPASSRGLTDTAFPSISLANPASLRALSQKAGRGLSPHRFRANLWLDGLAPWGEFDLVGRRLRLGHAVLEVVEPTGRCKATHADPETGARDTDILGLLRDGWGHTDFGVYARVVEAGPVAEGDRWAVA